MFVEKLVGETLSCALVNSGCTNTVCGSLWLQCYKNSLDEKDQANIVYEPSIRTFKFGDRKVIKSQPTKLIYQLILETGKFALRQKLWIRSFPCY